MTPSKLHDIWQRNAEDSPPPPPPPHPTDSPVPTADPPPPPPPSPPPTTPTADARDSPETNTDHPPATSKPPPTSSTLYVSFPTYYTTGPAARPTTFPTTTTTTTTTSTNTRTTPLSTTPTASNGNGNGNSSDMLGLGGSRTSPDADDFNLVKIGVPAVVGGVVLFAGVFAVVWWGFRARVKAKKKKRREAKGKGKEVVQGLVDLEECHGQGGQGPAGMAEYGVGRYELTAAMQEVVPIVMVRKADRGVGEVPGAVVSGAPAASGSGPAAGSAPGYWGDRHWQGGYV